MKNGTRPLYTLLRDPKPIATNGSAKKYGASLRKKIILGGLIAIASGVGLWQLDEYQQREQFITWVAKYRPAWSSATIRAQWDKIQYAREHTDIVESPRAVVAPTPASENLPPVRNLTRQEVGPIGPIRQQSLPADYAPDTHGGSL